MVYEHNTKHQFLSNGQTHPPNCWRWGTPRVLAWYAQLAVTLVERRITTSYPRSAW